MKRKITDKLCEWKKQTKGRMPLLIYGARQVGKTFEMREFGAHYYKNTVYINFETDEKIGSYFETDIHADSVVVLLEKYYQVKIVPEETLDIFEIFCGRGTRVSCNGSWKFIRSSCKS